MAVVVLAMTACGRVGFSDNDAADGDGADAAPTIPGLVAWYRFENRDGTDIPDSTGHGHTARCVSENECSLLVPGRVGMSLQVDADVRYEVDPAPELDTPGAFTIAAWLYSTEPTLEFACAAAMPHGMYVENAWTLCLDASNNVFFATVAALSTDTLLGPKIDLNEWHHVAVRWDGARKSVWIDGGMASEKTSVEASFDGSRVTIGHDLDDLTMRGQTFFGYVDELRIYNIALPPADIAALANPL